jgi:hypothetical protein
MNGAPGIVTVMDDEAEAPRYVNASYRERRELPPPSQPAIVHPATAAAIRLRLLFAVVLLIAALGLAAGAVAVAGHRSARKQELLRTGVAVPGRVVAQPLYSDPRVSYWGDDVQWSFAGQQYDDATTLTSPDRRDLPSVGMTVTVLVDRHDPSWFAINGVFTGRTRSSVSLALLVVPGLIAFLLAIGLIWVKGCQVSRGERPGEGGWAGYVVAAGGAVRVSGMSRRWSGSYAGAGYPKTLVSSHVRCLEVERGRRGGCS